MNENLEKKIEKKVEEILPAILERYRIYSKEDLLTKEEFLEAIKEKLLTKEEFLEAIKEINQVFEKRFEAIVREMHDGFDKIYEGFDKMHVILTSFGARAGVRLEKTIENLARKALEERQIEVSRIEYNKELIDDGTYFEKGYKTHIDMYGHDSKHMFFDIKYQYDLHDMHDFIKRVKLAENFLKMKSSKNIVIVLEISEETRKEAERRKLEIISVE